jgi:hypothetical protein
VSLKLTLRHLHSTQAQIIMRGTRSLGYGFVTYSSEAEAHKAVELLNKKEIAGREINVEGAKPQAAAPAEKPATAAAGEAEKDGAAARGASTRGRGRGRGRGGRGGVSACCMLTFSSASSYVRIFPGHCCTPPARR